MFSSKRSILILIVLIATGIYSCKKDNDLENALSNHEDVLIAAKYIYANLSHQTQQKGVYKLSVSGTQAFSSSYWGWEEPTAFLENRGKTVSWIKTLDSPIPDQYNEHSFNNPFADGSFSTDRVYTGYIRPKNITASSRVKYDTSGVQTTDTSATSHLVNYDSFSDTISQCVVTILDASGDHAKLNRYDFTEDPRSYSSHYVSSYTKYQGASDTRVGSINIEILVDSTSDNYGETYTYTMYDENGDLGSFDTSGDLGPLPSSTFAPVSGTDVIKIITTIVHYTSATDTIAANTIVTTMTKYSSASTSIFREVITVEYADLNLFRKKSYQKYTYTISNGIQTLASRYGISYTNGFETGESFYSVSLGTASLSYTTLTTRDAQGRKTAYVIKNSSDATTYQEDYTFDSIGRTSTVRSYSVNSSTGVSTCSDLNNKNYTYETVTDTIGQALKRISVDTYFCSSGTLQTEPNQRDTNTYNTNGQIVLSQVFDYFAQDYQLTAQTGYEYNSSNALIKKQDYGVAAGTATASSYTEYSYDSNLYRTSTKSYNASGAPTSEYIITTYTFK